MTNYSSLLAEVLTYILCKSLRKYIRVKELSPPQDSAVPLLGMKPKDTSHN